MVRAGGAGAGPGVWRALLLHWQAAEETDQAQLYWDTVEDCFGPGRELPADPTRLPDCVDLAHCPAYSLDSAGRSRANRVVTAVAATQPAAPHLPLLYPVVAAALAAGLQEEEVFSLATR